MVLGIFLKNPPKRTCLAQEFRRSGMLYRPSKSLKRCSKSSSLHSKKKFLLGGCRFFVSDIKSGGLLGHLAWPWAPTNQ